MDTRSALHRTTLLCAAALLAATTAAADSYRCGRKLIRTGDTAADVLRVCGEPRHKDRGKESLRLQGATQQVSVERWYYRQSGRSLERIVLLHRGRVVAIDVGGR